MKSASLFLSISSNLPIFFTQLKHKVRDAVFSAFVLIRLNIIIYIFSSNLWCRSNSKAYNNRDRSIARMMKGDEFCGFSGGKLMSSRSV